MDICKSQLACCCGPASCGLCCKCCKPIRESVSTRLMYMLFLAFTFIIQCLMQIKSFKQYFDKQAANISDNYTGFCLTSLPDNACYQMLGFVGVYKVGFAVWAFHVLLMLLTIRTCSSSDYLAKLHNGYSVWNTEKTCFWKIAPIALLLILYSSAVGAYLLLFNFYWHSGCFFHKIVIGVALGFSGLIGLAFILQFCTHKINVNLGLTQTPLVCITLAFFAWSSITSIPSKVEESLAENTTHENVKVEKNHCLNDPDNEFIPDYMGVVIMFILTIQDSLSASGQFPFVTDIKEDKGCGVCSIAKSCVHSLNGERSITGHTVIRDEANSMVYCYSYFHFISSLSALLLMMQVTGWLSPKDAHLDNFDRNFGAVWFKASCILLCGLACKPWPFRSQNDSLWSLHLCFKTSY